MQRKVSHSSAFWLAAALATAGLSGCASAPSAPPFTGTGVVLSIAETQRGDTTAGVAGAIGGAIVGGLIGSQIGGGTGQVIATTTGSAIGSVAGGAAASKATTRPVWQVSVRFEDGIDRSYTVDQLPDYRPGDRVTVSNGAITRLR